MQNVYCRWKENWEETRRHFIDWWDHSGLVLGMWSNGIPWNGNLRPAVPIPDNRQSIEFSFTDPEWIAHKNREFLAGKSYPADVLPIAFIDIGPVTLAQYLGAQPEFTEESVWYRPSMSAEKSLQPLKFDPLQHWFKTHTSIIEATISVALGDYFVGIPGIAPNLDVLAELRGVEQLMTDMLIDPGWVHARLEEINQAYFDCYDRIYEMVKLPDRSSVFGFFMLWGPGKVSQAQCDTAAMLSEDMFGEFVIPYLEEQCRWLDHSLFHVDGPDALRHLDALLRIDELDAIEFTPGPSVPGGGDPYWYPWYRRILNSGKSVQVVEILPDQVIPLVDAIGHDGVYLMVLFDNYEQAVSLEKQLRG